MSLSNDNEVNNDVLYDSVPDINGTKDAWKIKVKTILLWKQTFKNNPRQVSSSMDMIVMDEQGNKIQATVKNNLLPDFESLFEEGCIREVSNFGVASNTGNYMLVNHDCKINFFKSTKVRVLSDFVPAEAVQEYEFPTIVDLKQKNIDMRVAFDIVGEVVDNKPIFVKYEQGRETRVMNMQIQDLNGQKIPCALWGDLALQLHNYIVENQSSTAPVIMMIRNAKLKEWQGALQVSNSLFGTKVYISDTNVQPITFFKESMLATDEGESSSVRLTPLTAEIVVHKEEDYYLDFIIRNIDDIPDIKKPNTGVTIIATIISLQSDEGWYYWACRQCGKKARKSDGSEPYECDECGPVSDVYGQVRVVIRVQDATGSSSFVLFERHIASLTNRSAAFLLDKINKDEGRQVVPEEFKTLVNRKFVFKINVSGFNLSNNYLAYTVHKLTDDQHVMDVIFKRSPTYKEQNVEDDGTPNSISNKKKEIVSIMDDNMDVVDVEAITPSPNLGKRGIDFVDNNASVGNCSSSKAVEGVDKLKIPKMEKLE